MAEQRICLQVMRACPSDPSAVRLQVQAQLASLSQAQQLVCERYIALLLHWGRAINLTAVKDPEQIVTRHFADSLSLVSCLPATDALPQPTLLDVGSGAGFPGVLCALCRPDLQVTLCERVGKKAAFLLALRRQLGLSYEVVSADGQTLNRRFGLVVSRAALPLQRWLDLAQNLVAPSGFVYAMTSADEASPKLPQTLVSLAPFEYQLGGASRCVLGFRCVA